MFEKVKDKRALLTKAKEVFEEAMSCDRGFQKRSKESFRFRDNDQWEKDEKDILAEERRPALTFNIVKSHIDLLMGLNEDIKKRYTCSPVGVEDAFLCEVLNQTVYWLYQKNDWDSEEDNAFESALISGRGWVGIDFEVDERRISEIKITETSIPIHEIKFDPASRKRDLSDASYIIWDRWLSLEDFCVKYPKREAFARKAFETGVWPKSNDFLLPAEDNEGEMQNDLNDESDYSDQLDIGYYDAKRHQIRTCHMEYWKYSKAHFYFNPEKRKWMPVPGDLDKFKVAFPEMYPGQPLELESTIQKDVWWLQFCGEEILVHAKSPIDYPGFSIVPCFMYGDVSRRKGDHFGIVELMKDAQREINKRSSQTLNLFNQQVQPGVYAEAQAFVNTDQAEQSLKEPGSITWLKDGALAQQRFQERSVPSFPSAVLQMSEYSREMVRYMTGVNPDLLGMNDKRKEAGIVVQLRQQQGMAILKKVFKAYAEMKKQLFERQIRIVMAHMPIDQLLKIMGEPGRYENKEGVIVDSKTELMCDFRNVDDVAYDIDAEPENNSMTANALEMATFMELQNAGIPVDPNVVISKTNLPVSEKLAWSKYIKSQQQQGAEQAQAESELEHKKLDQAHEREMAKLKANTQIAMAKLRTGEEKDYLKVAMDGDKIEATKQRDQQTYQLKVAQLVSQAAIADEKARIDLLDIMLDADINQKRLILDTMEVMAQAGMAGQELKLNLVMEMYKATLDAKKDEMGNKVELLKKSIDAMSKIEAVKIQAEASKQAAKEGAKINGQGKPTKND